MQGDVIIIAGPPGAGKSTTARALAKDLEYSVHLHTDDFWHYIISGSIPPYLPESDSQNQTVMRVIAQAAFTYAQGGYSVVVDGIVGPWMLHYFDEALQETAATNLHYLILKSDRITTLSRATARTGTDDLTDEEPILAMWDQFSDVGRWERHVLDTTDQSPLQTLDAVREVLKTKVAQRGLE